MEYKTILIPHDGSKFSDKAVDVAIELAMITRVPCNTFTCYARDPDAVSSRKTDSFT